MPNGAELQGKYDRLKSILAQLPSLAVGLSGGVDSTLLLAAAVEALGDRLSTGAAGRRRMQGARSAGRGRPFKSRDPPAGARDRAAQLEQAGHGLPRVAHCLRYGHNPFPAGQGRGR